MSSESRQEYVPGRLVLPCGLESHPSRLVSRRRIKDLQDIVNRHKAKHKAEHLLLKRERKTETEKKRERWESTCQEREKKEAKMATRGQKSLGVGVACPLKGPETKRNNIPRSFL